MSSIFDGRSEREGTQPKAAFRFAKSGEEDDAAREWTSGDTTERVFDYVLKKPLKT
jgi:hypothetical protein